MGSGVSNDIPDWAMRKDPALMQDHEVIAGHDLVEQMRCPKYADALLRNQLADVVEDVGAGLDVEANGRLVKQQQPRAPGRFPRR